MRISGMVILTMVCGAALSAQIVQRYEQPIPTPLFFIASQDTFLNLNEDSLIAASLSPVDTTIREGKSTTIAMLASMIAPGTGQIYNESYWKAPVVWGLGAYFYSVYNKQNRNYKEYRSLYESSLAILDTTTDINQIRNLERLSSYYRSVRNQFKDDRNIFGWYLALTYLLNIVDAYVDAALFNFEVSPNLQGTNEWRVQMRIPLR
ncbi:MAG: DUF5683 domain-containing protein [Bacteroidota bacterium]